MEDGVNLAEIAAVVGAAPPPVVPLPDAAMDVEGGVQVSGTRLSPCQPHQPPSPPPPPALLAFPTTRIVAHTHCLTRLQVPMDSSLDSPCEKLAGSTPTTPGRDLPNELRDL